MYAAEGLVVADQCFSVITRYPSDPVIVLSKSLPDLAKLAVHTRSFIRGIDAQPEERYA